MYFNLDLGYKNFLKSVYLELTPCTISKPLPIINSVLLSVALIVPMSI